MRPLDADTAVDLVRRIQNREPGAESELVEICGPTLRFLTRRYARNEADAEDLYQETLILALEKIRNREVHQPDRLAGFLRSLAKNLSTQSYRRRRFQVEEPAGELEGLTEAGDADPLGHLLSRERGRLTRLLLAELRVPRDRDLLFRYYIVEQSSSRICADLGIDGDHFYRVLHRARSRYRRLWETQRETQRESPVGTRPSPS